MTPRSSKRFATLTIQWSEAAGAKDVDKTISFYSDDAIVMPPNAPSATTKEAIRKIWKDLLTDANISWKTKNVEVTQSGDLAFSSGTYEVTLNDPDRHASQRSRKIPRGLEKAGRWKMEACGGRMEFRSSCASGSCREEVGANCRGGRVGREFTCVTERSLDSHLR
jgi:ketosteroid isomerase-like protein